MTYQIKCPSGNNFKINDDQVGNSVQCPSCGKSGRLVPGERKSQPVAPPLLVAAPPQSNVAPPLPIASEPNSQVETTPEKRTPKFFDHNVSINSLVTVLCLSCFFSLLVFSILKSGVSKNERNSSEGATAHFTGEFEVSLSPGPSVPRKDPVTAFQERLLGKLTEAAQQEQHRQQAERDAGLLKLLDNTCGQCKGQGSYNYVDQFGNLQLATCKYCYGSGRR